MPFAKPDGGIPAGAPPGLTVYVVVEKWALDDPVDGEGWTIEGAYLTEASADANLEAPVGRERFIVSVEVQP